MQFDIRRFDIYRKIPKDLTQPTSTGAFISLCSVFFITYLFVAELISFLTIDLESTLTVEDPVKHSEKIPVFLNISVPKTSCEFVGLDIQDDMGRHEVGHQENTKKFDIEQGQGCRMETHFLINKVPGNFHVSTHSSRTQPKKPDMAHIIHKLRFGMEITDLKKNIKGSFNPVENLDRTSGNPLSTHDYILRIVPTVHQDLNGHLRFPFQYTFSYRDVVQFHHGGAASPAIWFRYELSPITVRYTEKRKPLYSFLTTFCAIIGGSFTVAGILDSLVFTATEVFKKAELGKLS
ncbi:hypothetical protein ScPMuIL_000050 [Solemya velum]